MNIWNTTQLAKNLYRSELDEAKKKDYLVFGVLLNLTLIYFGYLFSNYTLTHAVLELIVFGMVYYVGLQKAYALHRKSDGVSFVKVFMILSVPLVIKMFLLSFLLGFLVGLILVSLAEVGLPDYSESALLYSLIGVIAVIWYFWRICVHIEEWAD